MSGLSETGVGSDEKTKAAAEKQKRLEAALRANLRRRKAQQRERDAAEEDHGED